MLSFDIYLLNLGNFSVLIYYEILLVLKSSFFIYQYLFFIYLFSDLRDVWQIHKYTTHLPNGVETGKHHDSARLHNIKQRNKHRLNCIIILLFSFFKLLLRPNYDRQEAWKWNF